MARASHPTLALVLAGAATIGVAFACLIPDRGIIVRTTDTNLYPVRFVERIPLDEDAHCACSATSCECPLPRPTALPTYLDPADPRYQFCICGENRFDSGRLPGVSLYVEDQDEIEGEPDDLLYAVALLDWNPTLDVPAFDYVAYRGYLDPRDNLPLSYSTYDGAVIKRPRPWVRSVTLSDGQGFDLCNGAGRTVGPGTHTLTVMVTDRPWFQRDPMSVDTGDTAETGAPLEGMAVVLEGVPDIAAGATYDIQTYVFTCLQEGDDGCGCMDLE